MRVAAVDDGLLATLDRSDHVEQQMLLDQRSEVLEQLLLYRLLFRLRGFWQRVLARRATIGLDVLVEANETSLRRMSESKASFVRQRQSWSIPCK
jgi:bisphosphoglycerate-dependent phosphoglycerate mutase